MHQFVTLIIYRNRIDKVDIDFESIWNVFLKEFLEDVSVII